MSNRYPISGTVGIEWDTNQNVSVSGFQRTQSATSPVTQRDLRAPIDTPNANESCYCAPATEQVAKELFERWNQALQTGEPQAVAHLYWDDAILLPTVSNVPRVNHAEIEDYFHHFLQSKPYGTIVSRNLKQGCNKLTDAGVYEFKVVKNGEKVVVPARYTFVYEFRNGEWKISHHHSSMMPEKSF
ncbi:MULTISPECIES: SgcJ/EcaC family oxidoreductase [Thiomicrorhabdus]|uniref:SgcJ/EcaC family oxidoreductase n=1 Tax=Thiomicrorhabdus heinhorstiae TaxID=2748010 RepID=A0ABS0BUU4_9GAMM|nr:MULTISPECIES: SgcJ/EcaC family oxidoreductase [Thiomicrorhabdus]MBF6057099.1 SgcJ/EcaC family oxidoreductase [Thiomicrorhabdus heinhorstiae]